MNKRFQVISRLLGFDTLEDFSDSLGVHNTYIYQICRNGLNQRFAKKITEKFPRVNINYLETGEGDPLLPEGAFDPSDIERAGQVKMIVSVLNQLDPPTLRVILAAIEKFKNSPHYRRMDPAENVDEKPEKKTKKKHEK